MSGSLASTNAASPERDHGLLRAALDALSRRPKDGPGWLEARREEAARWFEAHGFPTSRDEAFRFTPIRDVLGTKTLAGRTTPFTTVSAHGAGLEVRTLRELLASAEGRVEPYLARGAALPDGFAALSTALLDDALVAIAAPGARAALRVTHVADSTGLCLPRLLVVAGRGSELDLVEVHGAGRPDGHVSAVTEVHVEDGARVDHVRLHDGGESRAVSSLFVIQARDSHYASRVFSFGGKLARLDLRVALGGPGAAVTLDGLYLAGEGALVDHHTTIDHTVPRCSSRERYKGVLGGNGVAVFDGTIVVYPGAAGTEAHQENRNLLLSRDAVVHAKPHLRIDADDVKCSHGATVGRLDPDQLFYLRSRGMDGKLARDVLTVAFAREIVEAVPDAEVKRELETRLARAFPGGMLAGEAVS